MMHIEIISSNEKQFRNKIKIKIRIGDIILLICAALIACVAAIIFSMGATGVESAADRAIIMVDGAIWREIPLDVDSRIVYEAGSRRNIIIIEDGGIRMDEANCPDGLCVKQGVIKDIYSIIVCLPNRVSIRLMKENGGGDGTSGRVVDVISG